MKKNFLLKSGKLKPVERMTPGEWVAFIDYIIKPLKDELSRRKRLKSKK
jgi:hypothetical protein